MSRSDLELLCAWKDGDRDAGEALFERHFDAVFRFVSSKVSDNAEDFVQQAFLGCVEGRHRLRDGATFRTYLFTSARNIVYDHWRGKTKKQLAFHETSMEALLPSPSSALAQREEERLLVRALRRIPLELQMALELYYVEGFKSREVAEILELPHGTLRTRLRRGLALVRDNVEALRGSPSATTTTISRLDAWAAEVAGKDSDDSTPA